MKRTGFVTVVTAVVLCGALAGAALSSPSPARVRDRCVRGEWRMSNATSNALLQSLIPSGNITVTEGVITAAFPADDRMNYGSTHFVVKLAAGPLELKGFADFFFDAPWATKNGKLLLSAGRSELMISKFTAIKDGRTVTVPGPAPIRRRTSPGAAPYTCNGNTLRWKIPLNDTWTLFRRVR